MFYYVFVYFGNLFRKFFEKVFHIFLDTLQIEESTNN